MEVELVNVFAEFGLRLVEGLRGLLTGWLVLLGDAEVWLRSLPW